MLDESSEKEIMLSLYDSIGPEEGPGEGEDETDEGTIPEEPEDAPEQLSEETRLPEPAPEASEKPGTEKLKDEKGEVGFGAGEESGGEGDGASG